MSRHIFVFFAGLTALVFAASGVAVAEDAPVPDKSFQVAQAKKPGGGGGGPKKPGRGGPKKPGPGKARGPGSGAGKGPPKGADCSGAGPKAASQTGGKVLSVSGSGGSCSVTVLVPGKKGGRPRKTTVTIQP